MSVLRPQSTSSCDPEPLAFANARVFDGWDVLKGFRTVLVTGDRITCVSERHEIPPGALTFDLAGKTMIPGLIDAHFHCNSPDLNVARADRMPASLMAQHARRLLEHALERGFTTVRDAGGADAGLSLAVDTNLIRGPRLYVSGLALSQTGGHGDFQTGVPICPCNQYSGYITRVVDGPDEMRRVVRQQLRDGAHQIKLFVSGGILSPTDPPWMDQFTDDEIRAAVAEAARWRTYVMAHCLSDSSVRRSIELGVRSIEHGMLIEAETAEVLARSGSFLVPTLSIFEALSSGSVELPSWAVAKAKGAAEQAARSLERCWKAGVKLGFGTDLIGELHGKESHELLLRAGIDGALSALRSATSVNARLMNLESIVGTLAAGAYADLVIVDGNPLVDMSLLTESAGGIAAVMKGGRFVHNRLQAA